MEPALYTVNGILNRRLNYRNECQIEVAVEDGSGNAFNGIIKNICPDGAFIAADQPLLTRKRELSITIPYQNKAGSKTVAGKIIWLGENGFGVNFKKKNQLP